MTEPSPQTRFRWYDTTNRLRVEAGLRRIPLIGAFELTARCNLSCSLCFIRNDDRTARDREIEAARWLDLAREARAEGLLFLLLTGGEPLLRPDFPSLYGDLSGMGFLLTLYTNGTLVGEKEARFLAHKPPSKTVVTLYGASAETYERVTGRGADFERAVAGIRRLRSKGIHTQVRATLSKDNAADLGKLRELARELSGTPDFEVSMLLTPPVRGATTKAVERRLTPSEMIALEAPGLEPDPGLDTGSASVSVVAGAVGREVRGLPDYAALPPMFCSGGRSSFWLAWDGRLLPCALMDSPFSRPFEEGFAPAWKKLAEQTDAIPGPDECRTCKRRPHCSVCPGRLQAETGSFRKVSPFLCDMAALVRSRDPGAG